VILVRHGESSYNVERRVQGYLDESTLTAAGRESARLVGAALSDLKFDAAYTSTLQRAKDTAELVLAGLKVPPVTPLQTTESLKEINLALWEGMLFSDVQEKYPEEYLNWRDQPHQMKMVIAGEDGQPVDYYPVPSLYERAKNFWKEMLPRHADQTVLIVGHSGINRALISTALGLPCDRYQSINQSNCGISVLNFAGGWGSLCN
jgi:broad specificity phosphatase PhoE